MERQRVSAGEAGLTKRQRRAIDREQKKVEAEALQKKQRNRLLGVGAVATAATLVLAVGANLLPKAHGQVDATPYPTGQPRIAELEQIEILRQEIVSLGIRESGDEKSLWQSLRNNEFSVVAPEDPKQREKAILNMIYGTLDAMSQSENPKFQDAFDLIYSQRPNGNLRFWMDQNGDTYAKTGLGSDGNILFWGMVFDSEKIFELQEPLVTALALTHESVHLRLGLEYQASHSNLGPSDLINSYSELKDTKEQKIREESAAYAEAAEAFIYERGLVGMNPTDGLSFLKDASALIRCGKDPVSECWTDYIQSDPKKLSLGE